MENNDQDKNKTTLEERMRSSEPEKLHIVRQDKSLKAKLKRFFRKLFS